MKTLSPHAAAAKAIRAELRAAFPHVTFSVKSRSFAGGDAVDVQWVDGPTYGPVDAIVGKYEQGHFDGMYDIYEYSNVDKSIPQVKYAHTRREYSKGANEWAVLVANGRYGYALTVDDRGYISRMTWQEQAAVGDILGARTFGHCPACGEATETGDTYCADCGEALSSRD